MILAHVVALETIDRGHTDDRVHATSSAFEPTKPDNHERATIRSAPNTQEIYSRKLCIHQIDQARSSQPVNGLYALPMRHGSLLLLALLCSCRASPAKPPLVDAPAAIVRVEYRGTIDLEDHLPNPGDTVPLDLTWAQTCIENTCLVEQTIGTGEQTQDMRIWSTPKATWIDGAPTRFSTEEASTHRRLLTLFSPSKPLPSATIRFAHPRLGTVSDRAIYEDYTPQGVPRRLSIDVHEADIAWRGPLSLHAVTPQPELVAPKPPPSPAEPPAPSLTALADGLWDVRVPAHDARSLVIEFASFVAVLEAPWSSSVGEQVVDLIANKFPDKPIRYVLYSHHHPHYTGGLRAFMAAGASVVAPTAHVDFVKSIADLDFSLAPDRLASTQQDPVVIAFDDTYSIEEAGHRVQVINIGERSHHTTAYNVFWLPEAKILIQGDLGWFATQDKTVTFGARSAGLLEAIDEHALPVETLVQTWPVNRQEPTLDMGTFRSLVETAFPAAGRDSNAD